MERGSYRLIAPGMAVEDGAGNHLGRVTEVVAEDSIDIFRGILMSPGLLRTPVFISQERVVAVTETIVTVAVEASEVAHLPHADQTVANQQQEPTRLI